MARFFASLFAAALLIGLGSAPTLTYAEEGAMEEAEEGAMDSGEDSMKEDSMKEDSMKEESDSTEESQADPMEEAEEGTE